MKLLNPVILVILPPIARVICVELFVIYNLGLLSLKIDHCGQSHKHITIVNYDSTVIIWADHW